MRYVIAIALLLSVITQVEAQDPQDAWGQIRRSLVYLEAEAETVNGVPLKSTATGFVVTAQGRVLTAYHLPDQLEQTAKSLITDPDNLSQGQEINRTTIEIKAHLGFKAAKSMPVEIVNALPLRELLLLDLPSHTENYVATCVKFDLDQQKREPIGTAGFPETAAYVSPSGRAG